MCILRRRDKRRGTYDLYVFPTGGFIQESAYVPLKSHEGEKNMNNNKPIANPHVLFLEFENQGGDWAIKILHAYGENKHYSAPLDENLSLQFQPVEMFNPRTAQTITGVGCLPLQKTLKEDNDAEPTP
jgi:hypothetical protein